MTNEEAVLVSKLYNLRNARGACVLFGGDDCSTDYCDEACLRCMDLEKADELYKAYMIGVKYRGKK